MNLDKRLYRDLVDICEWKRHWNNQPCTNPADIIHSGVLVCAACANRAGLLYDEKENQH